MGNRANPRCCLSKKHAHDWPGQARLTCKLKKDVGGRRGLWSFASGKKTGGGTLECPRGGKDEPFPGSTAFDASGTPSIECVPTKKSPPMV